MRKIILTLLFCVTLFSCADQNKRQKYLEKLYPKHKIEPSTGLIQQQGYEFIIIDSTNQIIAVDFYIGSEDKIMALRNIR